ncbi:MAG TPA: helix-turn-helix transcriptional regulator [Blastocatellia bacterium]|nr:helix-turn-helix transcriptional regulator [Blastocatellia bacterium]
MNGEKIREIREELGLTQEELAERLDLDRNSISRIELGKSNPQSPKMLELALSYLLLEKRLSSDEPVTRLKQMVTDLESLRDRILADRAADREAYAHSS